MTPETQRQWTGDGFVESDLPERTTGIRLHESMLAKKAMEMDGAASAAIDPYDAKHSSFDISGRPRSRHSRRS